MHYRRNGKEFIGLCVVLFVCLALAQAIQAGNNGTINESADLDFFTLQTTVMKVHPQNKYLIAGEKTIELVDFRKGNKQFRTMVKSSSGSDITLAFLKRGQKIFIRGFELPDGTIQAREIYQLPDSVKTRNDLRKYSFFDKVPFWESTIIK